MPTAAVSATGVASVLVAATTRLWGQAPPPVVKVTADGSFLTEWHDYDNNEGPPCLFYNASFQYTGALCSHFALARMSQATQNEALNRALACAAFYETDCILSPEIGLSVPAAFVYDEANGLKMLIAPKLVDLTSEYVSTSKHVVFQDPTEKRRAELEMRDVVNVEYLRGGARRMTTEVVNGTAAYCVQLLRVAFDTSCWSEVD